MTYTVFREESERKKKKTNNKRDMAARRVKMNERAYTCVYHSQTLLHFVSAQRYSYAHAGVRVISVVITHSTESHEESIKYRQRDTHTHVRSCKATLGYQSFVKLAYATFITV